ncbi:hypothetical protein HZA96_02265 [Candidatus Woesearchaeota archaeon]|nr:hypothetical protein [Candidatus Woesearchaeota archaeon]
MTDEKQKQTTLSREELLALSPEERIAKLKQFEDERKKNLDKEIAEAKKVLEDTEREIKQKKDQQLTDELMRRKILEEKAQLQKSLEETVRQESPQRKEDLPQQAEYKTNVNYMVDMYTNLKNILDTGLPLNPYERAKVEDIYNIMNQLANQNPHENADRQTIDDITHATKRIIKTLLGDYQSNVKYSP